MVCQVGSGGCFGIGECMPWARRTYGLHVASLPWVGGTGQNGTDGEGDSVEGHDLPSFPRGYPLDLPPPGMQGVPGLAPGLPPATRQDAWAWFGLAIGGFFGGLLRFYYPENGYTRHFLCTVHGLWSEEDLQPICYLIP